MKFISQFSVSIIFLIFSLTLINGEQVQEPSQQDGHGHEQATPTEAGGHAHHTEGDKQKKDPMKMMKDIHHIKEHLKEEYGYSDEQADKYIKEYDAQTQFFLMHDYDNNTKLDGLELLKSMTHSHDDHGEMPSEDRDSVDQTDTLIEFVDMVMKDQDLNDDGFIDYPEYISYYTKFDEESKKDKSTEQTQAQPS